jgi:hypothetical protein
MQFKVELAFQRVVDRLDDSSNAVKVAFTAFHSPVRRSSQDCQAAVRDSRFTVTP